MLSSIRISQRYRQTLAPPVGAVALVLSLTAGCVGSESEDDQPPADNTPPVAMFSSPDRARAGEPVRFDASASFDEDGRIDLYIFEFGDETPFLQSPDPVIFHNFREAGDYVVEVTVVDDAGTKDTDRKTVFIEE